VPSIPYEKKDAIADYRVGPGSYDPILDTVHKKLPQLSFAISSANTSHGPKKALESYIANIFQSSLKTDKNGGVSDLNHEQREDDFNTFRG
jgi:hypothetical protein